MVNLTAIVYLDYDNYVAECPEVGTAIQGDTIEQAISNLTEATEHYLEEFPIDRERKIFITSFETHQLAKVSTSFW